MNTIADLLEIGAASTIRYGKPQVYAPLYWRSSYAAVYDDTGYAGPDRDSVYAPVDEDWRAYFRANYAIRSKAFLAIAQQGMNEALNAALVEVDTFSATCPVTIGVNVFDAFYEFSIRGFATMDIDLGKVKGSDHYAALLKKQDAGHLMDLLTLARVLDNLSSSGQMFVRLNVIIQRLRIEWQEPFVPRAGFYGRKRRLGIG